MRRVWAIRACILGVVAALGMAQGRADDIAAVLPDDTALYVGWSEWLKPDAPLLRLQEKLVAAVGRPTTRPGQESPPPPWVGPLLELLPALETGSVGIGLFDVKLDADTPQVEAALVAAGPQIQRLPDAMHNLLAALVGPERMEPHPVQDAALECAHLSASGPLPIWGLHKGHFILALGDRAANRVIDCLENRAPSLATVEEFNFDRRKTGARADGRHICAYVDVQRVVARAKEIAAQHMGGLPANLDQLLRELGIASIRSKYLHIAEQDGQPRMTVFADVRGPLSGLLKLWDQKALVDDDLRIVPQDAYWAEITNVDLAALWQEVQRVLDVVAPDKAALVEGPLAMAQQILGFSITNELLPALGDTWAVFDAPEHGGILLTGTVLAVEVRDEPALEGMLERLVQLATPFAAQGEVAVQLKEVRHGAHTIHYVLLGGKPVPIAPAWGFAGQRCVFGLFPQTVATALRQVDPQTRGPSLLEQPDFKAARPKLPPNAQSVGYCDARYFLRSWSYPLTCLLQTAGVSMLAPYGVTMDLSLMQTLPDQMAEVTNYVGTTSTDPDGIVYASIGSGAGLPAAAGTTAMATSILLPSLSRTREQAKRAVSASNLKTIGMAGLAFASSHTDKFPDTLAQLVESGAIPPGVLLSPRDPQGALSSADRKKLEDLGYLQRPSKSESGADYSSYEYIAGQTTSSDARNVLAYERPVDNEGTNVLFVDGHVEWMDLDAFKAAVRETYRRLGREAELPPNFAE